jgi:hypothetical protein
MKLSGVIAFAFSVLASQSAMPASASDTPGIPSSLPDAVYFQDHTLGFNRRFFFGLADGRIWHKPNHLVTGIRGEWRLYPHEGLPFDLKADRALSILSAEQLSVDGNMFCVISGDRKIYQTMNALDDVDEQTWTEKWGHPLGEGPGHRLPAEYRDWSISYGDPKEHRYYSDRFGNRFFHFCTSIYVLWENGREIHLADPWTPPDWGYQLEPPERGEYDACSLSASGSTIFLIDGSGVMYTRQVDFDILGANPTVFYTYYAQKKRDGIFDRELQRGIPPLPWKKQPAVHGKITKRITIYSTGEGSDSRSLRVEGTDDSGNVGYYEKGINDTGWRFIKIDGARMPGVFLGSGNCGEGAASGKTSSAATYTGYLDPGKRYRMELRDFDFWGSEHALAVRIATGEWVTLSLFSRFNFRTDVRENPGADGSYFNLTGAIEIPPDAPATAMARNVLRRFLDYWPYGTLFLDVSLCAKTSTVIIKRRDGKLPAPLWRLDNDGTAKAAGEE